MCFYACAPPDVGLPKATTSDGTQTATSFTRMEAFIFLGRYELLLVRRNTRRSTVMRPLRTPETRSSRGPLIWCD